LAENLQFDVLNNNILCSETMIMVTVWEGYASLLGAALKIIGMKNNP
jgi:hypothetical protein